MLRCERPHGFVSVPAHSPDTPSFSVRVSQALESDWTMTKGTVRPEVNVKKNNKFFTQFIEICISSSSFKDHG